MNAIHEYFQKRAEKKDQTKYNAHIRQACMLWAEDYKRLKKENERLQEMITVLERKISNEA